uniref:MH2 domain-containing protein n=1 Tax=Strigamia maritima TaxID=126957 RepID=T1IIK7_STRMM
MISRRRILSRSRDDLNQETLLLEDEDDVWYQKETLYKDHIQEVLAKWTQIDDEIWAKIICLERNRRVAKAYARTPVLTINGSDDGFDGHRIGLNGFDNPMRDAKTEEIKRHIGQGIKIKMDTAGNILIKRTSKNNVFIRDAMNAEENSLSSDALKLHNGALEINKPVKVFDMKKFQHNVSYDSKKLSIDYKLRSRLPIPDEDPYSLPSNANSTSKERKGVDRPPKLPPRDASMSAYHIPKPDYDSGDDVENKDGFRLPHLQSSRRQATSDFHDDPYYGGFRAHIPNFAKTQISVNSNKKTARSDVHIASGNKHSWKQRDRSKSYDHAFDSSTTEDPYASIYSRLSGIPRNFQSRLNVSERDGY